MYRALKKNILLLCILLVTGFNTIYAHSYLKVDRYFSILNVAASESSPCGVEQELAPIIFEHTSVLEIQKPYLAEVTDTEEEEEESDEISLSSETHLNYGGSATAIFYAQMLGHLSSDLEKDPTYSNHHPFTTPYKRYIRFQVFRI
ncbi:MULTISPECIES: hypothetical protein [unclassified Arenibacter]|jgi:hypothetical protein|uniref:hypothetical protein n=1 Tax=unclassified Arenibacter TaxID=2615047 RepID=UPI000E353343|nr:MULTISPECIES: hypothetical protein [unclassified Arenibacter]MCM4163673.1 hypothetical protein [Arenibacter sp. A80]RFT56400.1 hypothetical protein D0S24_08685 [Arenibacter sp. P308M17]